MSDATAQQRRWEPGPQSGGRAGAPGRLGLVQAFLNTHFSLVPPRGTDRLATRDGLASWLMERDLAGDATTPRVTELQRAWAVAVREGLRSLLSPHRPTLGLAEAAAGLRVGVGVEANGVLVPTLDRPGVDGALGLVLAVALEAQARGEWRRMKACPGDHCGWAFYDRSRNNAGTWCSMGVCGGREKARAHRRRRG